MGAFRILIDQANDLTVIIFSGHITADDIFDATQKYLADRPTSRILWDYMEADGAGISSDDLQAILTRIVGLPNIGETRKIAVVVARYIGHVISHLSSIYFSQAGTGADFRIFHSLPEAMEWLTVWKTKRQV
jgi:hypothetical protein